MSRKRNPLRNGFSTGACAAAAAGAALDAILNHNVDRNELSMLFPDKVWRQLPIESITILNPYVAKASVIKDAGDDPDITHGAEIVSRVRLIEWDGSRDRVILTGGKGVGIVTKPGLPVRQGEPAINPVPRRMIRDVVQSFLGDSKWGAEVTVMVPQGEQLAQKTLNPRLGIEGGISILGTTGIVHPISAEAWTATISLCMDVCTAIRCDTVVLVTGRTSERAAQSRFSLPDECFVAMGDYLHFSLDEASKRPFKRVIVAAQWSKLLKAAMGWSQTHVRHGALTGTDAIEFLSPFAELYDITLPREANSARQIYLEVQSQPRSEEFFRKVMEVSKEKLYPLLRRDQELECCLVSYDGDIISV